MRRKTIVIGTRGSALALKQAEAVRDQVKRLCPGVRVLVKKVKTSGDRIQETPLAQMASTRIFTKELDEALLAGKVDLAVHSLKDIATELPEGLVVGAIMKRLAPGDVVIAKDGKTLSQLPAGARVGTSSLRRKAFLLRARPDLEVVVIRGNLDTRLRKLEASEFDAIVVAQAGLERMGWQDRVTEQLAHSVMLPAVGQGALGLVIRRRDPMMLRCAKRLNHAPSAIASHAERAFLRRLGGGCKVPVGGFALVKNGRVALQAAVLSADGRQIVEGRLSGTREEAVDVGERLAAQLLAKGAGAILQEARSAAALVNQDV